MVAIWEDGATESPRSIWILCDPRSAQTTRRFTCQPCEKLAQ